LFRKPFFPIKFIVQIFGSLQSFNIISLNSIKHYNWCFKKIGTRVPSPQLWWTFTCFNHGLPRSMEYASIPFSTFNIVIDIS
jgi:hypothetical protein